MGPADSDAYDSKVGVGGVSGIGVIALTAVFVGYALVLVYAAMAFWPPTLPLSSDPTAVPPATTTTFFGQTVTIAREQNLLLLVAVLGSLGAMAYVLRSFYMYVGQRRLRWSWVASYFTTPFLGAVMATIVYILLRAGLVGGSGTQEGNIWGFAAVATLVGLFNVQAASKLKDIFEVIFATREEDARDVRDKLDAPASSAGASDGLPAAGSAAAGATPALQIIASATDADGGATNNQDAEVVTAAIAAGAADAGVAGDSGGTDAVKAGGEGGDSA
jgi:hypothetical protein